MPLTKTVTRSVTKRAPRQRLPTTGYPPEVQQLTNGLRDLIRKAGKTDVLARAEIGARLDRIRNKLEHGSWLSWLEREVPFTNRSAESYIELAHFAQGDPTRFGKIAELGPTKVYLLMRLPRPLFDRLLAPTTHVVPNAHERKSLAIMTLPELMDVVANLSGRPTTRDSADELVAKYRRRVHGLVQTIDLLVDNHDHIPATQLEDLHDHLLAAVHRLATTFTLDE